jgi:hypothetical protein
VLEALLEQAGDGRLRAADRAMQQDDALLGAVALAAALSTFTSRISGMSRPNTASLPPFDLVAEEVVADELLLVVDVLFGARTQ